MFSGLTLTIGAALVMEGPLVDEGASEVDEAGEDDLEEDDALDDGPDAPDVVDGADALPDDPDAELPPPGTVTAVPEAPLEPEAADVGVAVTNSVMVRRSAVLELQPATSSAAATVRATGARKRRVPAEGTGVAVW
ncbi:MAG: hypothetical protein WKF57_10945 [Nakamurella sp.]